MLRRLLILFLCSGILTASANGFAQEIAAPIAIEAPADRRLPLVFDGEALFRIGQLKNHSAENRVKRITEALEEVADDPLIPIDSIHAVVTDVTSDIVAGEHLIMTLTDEDAARTGKSRFNQCILRSHGELVRPPGRGREG
jgi:hypothetical protein